MLKLALLFFPLCLTAAVYDVKTFGAKADGTSLDTASINKAIEAAAAAGGGTVVFSPGTYISGSIRLKSNITLNLEAGATLEASADPKAYDAAEPNEHDKFQDFGHSHWHNSLIWGENLQNVAIVGQGMIHGKGLTRGEPRGAAQVGNKAIALKLSRNITIRDISILSGGHFAILATGVDNLTIDNVKIDTNRDGIDIDASRNVRISNTSVNSPHDDGIVLKSSFALGIAKATEHVSIVNCFVSGYDVGSLLDGSLKRNVTRAPDRDGPTGRVKFGTESNGGFKNITISNVVFDRSRGLALETVDGGAIEDIAINNITMRDVSNSPVFLRIGKRLRGPQGIVPGTIRRVVISNLVASNADPRYASIISGIPGTVIEDIKLSNIRIAYRGGMTLDQVAKQPADIVNTFFYRDTGGIPPREPYATPEREKEYPEPSMFGLIPAYGFFIRHAKGIELTDVRVSFDKEDRRPAFVIDDVTAISLRHVQTQKAEGIPTFFLRNVRDLTIHDTTPVPDTKLAVVDQREL